MKEIAVEVIRKRYLTEESAKKEGYETFPSIAKERTHEVRVTELKVEPQESNLQTVIAAGNFIKEMLDESKAEIARKGKHFCFEHEGGIAWITLAGSYLLNPYGKKTDLDIIVYGIELKKEEAGMFVLEGQHYGSVADEIYRMPDLDILYIDSEDKWKNAIELYAEAKERVPMVNTRIQRLYALRIVNKGRFEMSTFGRVYPSLYDQAKLIATSGIRRLTHSNMNILERQLNDHSSKLTERKIMREVFILEENALPVDVTETSLITLMVSYSIDMMELADMMSYPSGFKRDLAERIGEAAKYYPDLENGGTVECLF